MIMLATDCLLTMFPFVRAEMEHTFWDVMTKAAFKKVSAEEM